MRKTNPNAPFPLLKDYGVAVARAIAWLGDRYLLANPVNVAARARVLPDSLGSSVSSETHADGHAGGRPSSSCRPDLEVTS